MWLVSVLPTGGMENLVSFPLKPLQNTNKNICIKNKTNFKFSFSPVFSNIVRSPVQKIVQVNFTFLKITENYIKPLSKPAVSKSTPTSKRESERIGIFIIYIKKRGKLHSSKLYSF